MIAVPSDEPVGAPQLDEGHRLYLDLLKKTLTRYVTRGDSHVWTTGWRQSVARFFWRPVQAVAGRFGIRILTSTPFDPGIREGGRDWPIDAETMVGLQRLSNIEAIVADVVARKVAGDLVETGVWRGGASIFMRAVLRALGDSRAVWLCDSFSGLPKPDFERYPADAGDTHWQQDVLAVSADEVRSNFSRYGLLDNQVRFLVGWFRDTLPDSPIEHIAVLRLDGDMYESTYDALRFLYPKVSPGGYVIVDDFHPVRACRKAVVDYRTAHGISETMHEIDGMGIYWRRSFVTLASER